MKKCAICGIVKSKTYRCIICEAIVCLTCFHFPTNECVNCMEKDIKTEYNEYDDDDFIPKRMPIKISIDGDFQA